MNTVWTNQVDTECPLPEYPRPQLARRGWVCLNGRWDYAINSSSRQPGTFDGEILVPFSPETRLSGVQRRLRPGEYLWYRREVALPDSYRTRRVLLHFGAVDQSCTVWVNGVSFPTHTGGYTAFSYDITDAVDGSDTVTVLVRVTDDTDKSYHTRGKQKTRRGGIWYTSQSGIWQTVWMEAVPEDYVRTLRITPNFDSGEVHIEAELCGDEPAYAHFGSESYALPAVIPVPDFEPWSPENPKLYGFTVSCGDDLVQSYFAMRKFSVEKDSEGIMRLFLNNEPYFHNGVLDQGYWPDGLYTAPTDAALCYDIEVAKASGYNMLRKHIKVEPLRWYYHCDRLGMLVWQDMPCGGGYYAKSIVTAPLFTGIHLPDSWHWLFGRGKAAGREEFKAELKEMIRQLYNCPCIAMWVPFNEGWGQFDSAKIYELIRSLDKSRTVDPASGWHDQGVGRVRSDHVYFRSYRFRPDKRGRAVLLSEFGGYAHPVVGHTWNTREFGYKSFEMPVQLQIALEELYERQIRPAVREGLSAAVYTQMSDVEDEINGLVTYDRRVVKIAPEEMSKIVSIQY